MSKHHPLGPSRLPMYEKCPGAYYATERIKARMTPEEFEAHTGSEAAAEGTMLHEVMAGTPPPAPLTDEQEGLIARSREYEELTMGDCTTVEREIHLTLNDGFDVLTAGTADVVGITADKVVKVIDWKYGRKWVPADSLQGKAYAAAAMQTYNADVCEFHIYQPRAGDGKPVLYTDFDTIFSEVKAVIEQAKSPYARVQAGEACSYCPARGECTAAANLETALEKQTPSMLADPKRLGEYAEVATAVSKRCALLIAANKEATIAGQSTGWKVIEKAGRPSINDARVARDRLLTVLTNEEYLALLSMPYGKLRDAVAPKLKERDGLSKVDAEAWMQAQLGDCFDRGAPSQVCVLDKLKRGG